MYGIICSPLWLSYNIINFAVGAIICETVNIFSLALAIWRLDIKGGISAGAPDSSLHDDKGEDDEYDGNVIG